MVAEVYVIGTNILESSLPLPCKFETSYMLYRIDNEWTTVGFNTYESHKANAGFEINTFSMAHSYSFPM